MVYEGEWMDGKKHKGIMTITKNNETIKADGEWKENLGRGDITYQDNSKYNGEWKFNPDNNTIVHQGQGKLKRKDHIFEGRWNNNNFDEGIHITLKDNKVTGTYKGKFVTKNNGGVYPIQCSYKTDEYIYTGSWHNNGMFNNGHVQFTQGDKERINGAWNEDKSGKGTIIYKDGSRYEGDLKFLQRHGNGTMYDKDGNIVIQATWNYDIIYQS
jgi:hypothetical protein